MTKLTSLLFSFYGSRSNDVVLSADPAGGAYDYASPDNQTRYLPVRRNLVPRPRQRLERKQAGHSSEPPLGKWQAVCARYPGHKDSDRSPRSMAYVA